MLSEPFFPITGVGRIKRPVPISKVAPAASRLMTLPEIVTPAAAALTVTPSMMAKEECATMSNPLISTSDNNAVLGNSGIVLDPITKVLEGSSLITVPLTVAAGPPAEMVVPAMEKADGFGVNTWPATLYTLLGKILDGVGRLMVLLPIFNAPC